MPVDTFERSIVFEQVKYTWYRCRRSLHTLAAHKIHTNHAHVAKKGLLHFQTTL